MLAQKERQQTGVNNKCWLGASYSIHTHTHTQRKIPVRSERGQIDRCLTHTRTLASLERASANRCKKLQSINKLAQKKRQRQIQMNQIKYKHTHRLQRTICNLTGWLTDVRLSRKTSTLRSRVSKGMQYLQNCKGFRLQKIVGRDFLTAQSDSGSWQI